MKELQPKRIVLQQKLASFSKGGSRTWTSALSGLVLAGGWSGIRGGRGNGAVVMVGNGGRQEGSLLKTPFYVHPHDTKHKCLETKVHIQEVKYASL